MSRTYRAVSILVVVAIVAIVVIGGYYVYNRLYPKLPGVVSEKIERDGDTWQADFAVRIGAPEQAVFDAIKNVENNPPSGLLKSVKVVEQNGNEKTVEMQMAAPMGQTLTTQLQFHYFPAERRIIYQTVGGGAFNTQAEYRLADEGSSTLLKLHETTSVPQGMPVPDAVVEHAIRGIFLAQIQGLNRKLNLNTAQSDEDNDEP